MDLHRIPSNLILAVVFLIASFGCCGAERESNVFEVETDEVTTVPETKEAMETPGSEEVTTADTGGEERAEEKPAEAAESREGAVVNLVEMYKDVKVGDYVKLEVSNGTEQTLFVAAKDDKTVTIETKEYDRGFLVVWRQLVIDKELKQTVLLRDKDAFTKKIVERRPNPEESIDEVLQAELVLKGEERLRQTLKIWDEEKKEYVEEKRNFECKVYKSVILDKRYVEIWYAKEVPLYPVKANLPGLKTTIRLVSYGSGMKSKFFPAQKDEKPEG